MGSIIRICDVETTGFKASEGHTVVEVAAWDVTRAEDGRLICRPFLQTFVNPCRTIPPSTMAVHHIRDREVIGAPLWAAVAGMLEDDPEPIAFCAHHAAFERQWFDPPDVHWIDTWKVALRLRPDLESHSNQACRYALGLELDSTLAMPPHRASPDAYCTAHILMHFIDAGHKVAELIRIGAEPALLVRVGFGEHVGKPWSEVPWSYLDWILKKDFDEDIIFTAQHELARRQEANKQEEF